MYKAKMSENTINALTYEKMKDGIEITYLTAEFESFLNLFIEEYHKHNSSGE